MRLAFAAGILAQTLTASSSSAETHKTAPLLARAERRLRVQELLLSKNNDPAASDPRIKDLKRNKHNKGSGFFSSLQAKRNAVLHNEGNSEKDVVPCDPTSSDPDIGILSCGMGKYCSESADYDVGGVCVDSSMNGANA